MAQMKKVSTDVIVPVWFRGWSTASLRSTFASLERQVTPKPNWRVIVVDGSGAHGLVESLARTIITSPLLCYEPVALRTGAASDLLYQGISMSRSTYVTYIDPGHVWDHLQLARLMGMAHQSRAAVVAEGDVTLEVDWLSDDAAAFLPLLGSRILHTRKIYEKTMGWPRRRNDLPAVRANLWQQMVIAGGEVFTATRPYVPAPYTSQPANQQMLFDV